MDRPASSTEDRAHEPAETGLTSPVKLDATAHAHIEKHRYGLLELLFKVHVMVGQWTKYRFGEESMTYRLQTCSYVNLSRTAKCIFLLDKH